MDLFSETLASMAGITIGILSLLVPLISVVADRRGAVRSDGPVPSLSDLRWTRGPSPGVATESPQNPGL